MEIKEIKEYIDKEIVYYEIFTEDRKLWLEANHKLEVLYDLRRYIDERES